MREQDKQAPFFDTHTHVLPGMDDGSSSLDESLRMLDQLVAQGVSKLCLTSHFYAWRESKAEYLQRRTDAYEQLKPLLADYPVDVYLGAEVRLAPELFNLQSLDELCLGDSRLLLLELPFRQAVDKAMLDDVDRVQAQFYVTPVLAHYNRYELFKQSKLRDRLREQGYYLQLNLEAFLGGPLERRRAVRHLREGIIDMLGTDTHNTSSRPPRITDVREQLQKEKGALEAFDAIYERTSRLLGV